MNTTNFMQWQSEIFLTKKISKDFTIFPTWVQQLGLLLKELGGCAKMK
jgi:hypothetical protein